MSSQKNILVTGGAGYIGSHTVLELSEKGFNPIIVDNFSNCSKAVLAQLDILAKRQITTYDLSCQDEKALDLVFKSHEVHAVIHFAADKAVGESVKNPLKYFSNNVGSLISLLKVMESNHVYNLIFSSSCTVYGDTKKESVSESDFTIDASSPYGHSKVICEQILNSLTQFNPNWKICNLRYFNPIGAHPSGKIGDAGPGIPTNVVPYLMQVMSGILAELSVHGNDYPTSDGTCVRDYLHVCDLAAAHVEALHLIPKLTEALAINVGTGKGISVLELINAFETGLNMKLPWKFGPRRTGDAACVVANVDLAKKRLNWNAKYSIQDALIHAWAWEKQRNNL